MGELLLSLFSIVGPKLISLIANHIQQTGVVPTDAEVLSMLENDNLSLQADFDKWLQDNAETITQQVS